MFFQRSVFGGDRQRPAYVNRAARRWIAQPAKLGSAVACLVAFTVACGTSVGEGVEENAAAPIAYRGRAPVAEPAVDPGAAGTIVAHAVAGRVVAYAEPDRRSSVIETFRNPVERGGPLVFQAVDRGRNGWLEVRLPIRPNGTTGWVRLDDVELTVNPYRIEVDASTYRLTVYRSGREQLTTTIAVGNGATPTPIGDFYLIELLRPNDPDGLYGPFAYGLSGYSDTLASFNGGEGVIGIHGTNRPDLLGGDVSHGCIRVANPTISEMTEFLPLGTPVSIFRSSEARHDVAGAEE